jgi:hypothetical protein
VKTLSATVINRLMRSDDYGMVASEPNLSVLVGRRLGSIEVREECLIFTVEDVELTARTDVYYRGEGGGETIREGQDIWIDMLCGCIERSIVKAEQWYGTDLVMTFDDESKIFLSLRDKDRTGSPAVEIKFSYAW